MHEAPGEFGETEVATVRFRQQSLPGASDPGACPPPVIPSANLSPT